MKIHASFREAESFKPDFIRLNSLKLLTRENEQSFRLVENNDIWFHSFNALELLTRENPCKFSWSRKF